MPGVYQRARRRRARMVGSNASMPLWKITLSYDGTDFFGWQVQPGRRTIQGELREALGRITGEDVLPQGSGRTDTGVHALGQVASFALRAPIPAGNLERALQARLPPAIRVVRVEVAEPPFHARHSARWKTYEYRIFPRRWPLSGEGGTAGAMRRDRACDPFQTRFVWDCGYELDLERLNRAAAAVCGTHDFSSFAAAGAQSAGPDYVPADPLPVYPPSKATPCRTLTRSLWEVRDELVVYTVRGSGFLHHMVRNLVGTFVLAGSGRIDASSVPGILAARSRAAAGPTAPARGLFLVSVEY